LVSNADNTGTFTGDGTSGIYLWGADLRVTSDGVGIPDYQRVNTATDYDTVGFPVYLRADGSNDFLQTNSIDFTGTDKMTICAGVRKLSDNPSSFSTIIELSTFPDSNPGTFVLGANSAAAADRKNYAFGSRGAGPMGIPIAATGTNTFAAPITNVLTGLGDISGDSAILRVNGSQAASNTADQGTGNYGNYLLILFSRNAAGNFFNGRFYGGVVRGAQSSAQQISDLESFMNTLTKAY
jgi:hypothetical protein